MQVGGSCRSDSKGGVVEVSIVYGTKLKVLYLGGEYRSLSATSTNIAATGQGDLVSAFICLY